MDIQNASPGLDSESLAPAKVRRWSNFTSRNALSA
jgi:hypothetical protein